MTAMPKWSFAKLLSLVVLAVPVVSAPVQAEGFLCDATQASNHELPILDKACPIGQGLWGKQQPKGQKSIFWIQCGVFAKPLSLAEAKDLYQHISTDVWAKPEGKGYRCLIGPYEDIRQARKDLVGVKKQPGYKESFVREVVSGKKRPVRQPVKETSTAAKPAQKTTVLPPAKPKPEPVVKQPVVESPPKAKQVEIAIRLSTEVAGVSYKVPYMMFSDDQFYMEHGLPWNRLDYDGAMQVCSHLNMRLPSESEWNRLLATNVMKEKWPIHLPYWGADRRGLFTSGKVTRLKGTSLLNVMCVK
ncbi:SPOR domain-containing protein [Vibrio sp. TRT 21S02]|uniref:SPOR domain-containing protein n=1 Tax=Vibrio sp. TRT 21S02 TaxID=3418507 RepID=UPI003CE6F5C6